MSAPDRDKIMGHGNENDGIEEYDNPLPDWWLGMFIFCIFWAVGYAVDYHFISDRSQAKSYDAEIADALVRYPAPDTNATAAVTPENIEAGKTIFAQNCTGCHGADMHGKIGPNLTDDTWIHGGTLPEIQATITNGVPDKGMLTWGPILGPDKVAKVAAFVWSSGPKQGS
jgi:cytochrome c oxidase cbb3-type subunit 3